ncbi:gamma-glutamylcyclotransferase [Streptomyces rectiverticillatus]|uniref:gamma-glutamylcyclotransferase family protein n=1 Tax=Streptomyces rectiverticillatus TaxID=173860 RepID=UPI0015C36D74|nr:gamma-glutamylcyclotransferase family protein [Streptomyces rectiverticillatus]QLE75491.1 gamma-glutamylcyclotransferase [Streptomyces rectiverticillatus]
MAVEPERLPVFVYGTLRPGQVNHGHYLRGRTVAEEPARLRGAVLYEGPGYPYAVAEPGGEIRGELIFVAPGEYAAVLASLDELEECGPDGRGEMYVRVGRQVLPDRGGPVHAWVYLAADRTARRLRAVGTRVTGGSWPHGPA